jgi:hypothetical protein
MRLLRTHGFYARAPSDSPEAKLQASTSPKATDLSEMGLKTHFVSELLGHCLVGVTGECYIRRR